MSKKNPFIDEVTTAPLREEELPYQYFPVGEEGVKTYSL